MEGDGRNVEEVLRLLPQKALGLLQTLPRISESGFDLVAGKAIISSAVAGALTLNPVVFATLTGFGLVVKGVASFKKYDKKAEKANFTLLEYKKILDTIRFHLRGERRTGHDADELRLAMRSSVTYNAFGELSYGKF